jgi:NAD(P)-dependent dehydrogenase (short-subunit alcohol dehydrogenase family)
MPKLPNKKADKVLQGKIALVAGATRGAGRGIAIALGEAGATVYCTGRSSRKGAKSRPAAKPGVSETIEETAELVTAAGGSGIAMRVDHTVPTEVKKLVAQIKRRHKHLDILVNDIWGGDALTEFGKPFWKVNLENGLHMLKAGRPFAHHHVTLRGAANARALRRKHLRNHRRRCFLLPRQYLLRSRENIRDSACLCHVP